jgi:hypothetical protein
MSNSIRKLRYLCGSTTARVTGQSTVTRSGRRAVAAPEIAISFKDVLSASLASSKTDRSVITSSSSAQIAKSTLPQSHGDNAWLQGLL